MVNDLFHQCWFITQLVEAIHKNEGKKKKKTMRCSFVSAPSATPLQSSPCKGRVLNSLCRSEEGQGGLQ